MKSAVLISILSGILLCVAFTAEAQSDDACFDLSDDACQFLESALDGSLSDLDSFRFNLTLDFALDGLQPLGLGEDVMFAMRGSGQFQALAEGNALAFDGEIITEIENQNEVEVENETQPYQFIILADQLYFSENDADSWLSISLDTLTNLSGFPPGTLPTFPETDAAPLTGADLLDGLAGGLGAIPDLVSLTDASTSEAGLRAFDIRVDFAPLFQSEMFQDTLSEALSITRDLDPNIALFEAILPDMLSNSRAELTFSLGFDPEDRLLRNFLAVVDSEIDFTRLYEIAGIQDPEVSMVRVRGSMALDLYDLNAAVEITPPESAVPGTLSDLPF